MSNNYSREKLNETIREYKKFRLQNIIFYLKSIFTISWIKLSWLFQTKKNRNLITKEDKIRLNNTFKECYKALLKISFEILNEKIYSTRIKIDFKIAWFRRNILTYNIKIIINSICEVFNNDGIKLILIALYF